MHHILKSLISGIIATPEDLPSSSSRVHNWGYPPGCGPVPVLRTFSSGPRGNRMIWQKNWTIIWLIWLRSVLRSLTTTKILLIMVSAFGQSVSKIQHLCIIIRILDVNECGILTGSESHDLGLCVCLWCDVSDWRWWWRSSHTCCTETSSESAQHKHKNIHLWLNLKTNYTSQDSTGDGGLPDLAMLFSHMGNVVFPVCVACVARRTLPPWGGLHLFCLLFLLFIFIRPLLPIRALQLQWRPWTRGSSWR